VRDARAARQPALQPRNKILATSLLIEAFLYEEQTRRGVSIRHWDEFSATSPTTAPSATSARRRARSTSTSATCRWRCATCCARWGKKRFNPGTAASMFFLNATDPDDDQRRAQGDDRLGLQGAAARARPAEGAGEGADRGAAVHRRQAAAQAEQVIHFVNKKMPGNLPKKAARALLDIEDARYVPIIRDPKATAVDAEAVFYFPGCGSERLFSQVGLATQAMLWHVGVQTVLPPGYLCCGYPQRGAGQFDKAEQIITDNRVLFHRVANTLNYLDIKTVVVSCGTCYDQLQSYEFEKIFPGCRIVDIHEFLMEKGVRLEGVTGTRYMYHDPCHSPMKTTRR
jgi:hypothetical protein